MTTRNSEPSPLPIAPAQRLADPVVPSSDGPQPPQQLASTWKASIRRFGGQWLRRLFPTWRQPPIDPIFQHLADDSRIFSDVRGFQLMPSCNLLGLDFVTYPLRTGGGELKGLLLAPAVDISTVTGQLGIELVSPDDQILVNVTVSMNQIGRARPVGLNFTPITLEANRRYWLRVFVRNTTAPFHVLEWQRRPWWRLGRLEARAFCGLIFV
jgi:hypothetical protein